MSIKLKFLDVSKYQSTVNYATVAKSIDGVIIRLGYRGYGTAGTLTKDSMFETHIKGFINAGVKRIGVYFLSQAITENEAVKEAEFCSDTLANYKDKITYPVFLDSEWSNTTHNGRADSLSKADRTKISLAFLNKIKKLGYTAGIYASTSWFSDKLDDSQLKNFSHWIADYRTNCGYLSSYDGWQYTETGTVAGISSKVDLSYFYKDFSSATTATSSSSSTTSTTATSFKQGQAVKLTKANLYASQDSTTPAKQLTGTYYIYDGTLMKFGRYRITTKKEHCGKGTAYITGYVAYTNFK